MLQGQRWLSYWQRLRAEFPLPWTVFWAGLLARLLIMPFATHSDFIHLEWISACTAAKGESVFRMQILLVYFHTAYQRLVSFLLPSIANLCGSFADFNFTGTSDWFIFINRPQVFRELFVLKLPYLVFDVACALLLYRLGKSKKQAAFLFKFWWLNPLIVFATYFFARHETITLFVILLSIYWFKQNRFERSFIALGAAVALRYYALFLLPFYVLSLDATWKQRLKWFALGLGPWAAVNGMTWLFFGSPEASRLATYPTEVYVLPMKFSIAAWDNVYIFPLLYFLLLLHRFYNREYGLRALQRYGLISLLLLFATAYVGQSPHYWPWFIPLLALEAAEDRRLAPLHLVLTLCLFAYSFIGSRSTAGYLLGAIAPDFFWSLPSPIEWIGGFFSPETAISLAHTAFSATALWIAFLVFRQLQPPPLADSTETA